MSELCPIAAPLEVPNETQAETANEAFLSFLKNKRLCDVTFVFENSANKIEAHQFCLRARSPVFDSMFRGLGSSMREVQMEDSSLEIVEKFLEFIYADKFDVTPVQALHLLHLGHKYNVQPLVKRCKILISEGLSAENAIEIYETAEQYELVDLRDEASDIVARSLESLLKDPKIMKVKDTTLIALLRRSDLAVKETDLFQLVVQWGRQNSSGDHELSVDLTELLRHIRFTNMTSQEFTTVVWPTKLVAPEDTINIYAYINGDESIRSVIAPSLKFETSSRNVNEERAFEEIVTFASEPTEGVTWDVTSLDTRTDPYKECISTIVSGLCDKGKTFKIQSVFLKWPTRTPKEEGWPRCDQPLPINLRVRVMRKHSSIGLYEIQFSAVVNNSEVHEDMYEVAIEPPVEILNDFHYFIDVVDEYPWGAEREYTYHFYEVIPLKEDWNEACVLSNMGVTLNIPGFKRNDCLNKKWQREALKDSVFLESPSHYDQKDVNQLDLAV